MSRVIKLIDYLPLFLQEYREIQAIMTAENPEIQNVRDETQVVLDNTFIMNCDENGVSKFEKLLKVYPATDDSLEARKDRVMTRWNDVVPYNMTVFKAKIVALQGNDDVEVVLYNDIYKLKIITHLEKPGQQENLAYLFKTIVPCNMAIESLNLLNSNSIGSMIFSSRVLTTNNYNLK